MTLILITMAVLLSGFFSASEIAFFSLSEASVYSLIRKKHRFSKLIYRLKSNPERLLITILIGNNIVNIGASSLVAVFITEKVGSGGVGIATGVMTLIILTFGEIIPKTIATKINIKTATFSAIPLQIFQFVLFPIIIIFESMSHIINKFISKRFPSQFDTESEVTELAKIGYKSGQIEDYEHDFIKNVFTLNDTLASKAMTPREKIFFIESDSNISQAVNSVKSKHYSRIPITDNNLDNIIGFLYVRDILKIPKSRWSESSVKEIMRKPVYVKANHKLNDVFDDLVDNKTHLAIVQSGSKTVGIITVEDILEEMLGDIEDETDPQSANNKL